MADESNHDLHTSKDRGTALHVAILYKKNMPIDEQILMMLEKELVDRGYKLFIDRAQTYGIEWAREVNRQIQTADAVVPLLSEASVQSELIGFEIESAHELAQQQSGRPSPLPVRVNYTGPLPTPLADILDPSQYFLWRGPEDDQSLVNTLLNRLKNLPPANSAVRIKVSKGLRLMPRSPEGRAKSGTPRLEPVGGAMPLDSDYYLIRKSDAELCAALAALDSIILIKGARQMGKTSMLARGVQFSRERGANVALTDFQKFNAASFESVETFYLSLAESLVDQLDLAVFPSDVWDENRGANVNFERYLRREVLGKLKGPLVWGLDEVDRLFVTNFGSEVFGLFRSWHNERALDPTGPWSTLTLAIAYATEAHLFITDMNQSPFNIGTRLSLEDFSKDQVAELNRRHGSPLANAEQLDRFVRLVDGHPYLVRVGLHEMASKKIDIATLEAQAGLDEGIFGDHLRRILILLAKDPVLEEIVRGILSGKPCPTPESFYRLRSAGVMAGSSAMDVRPRCRLYANYLSRHLT